MARYLPPGCLMWLRFDDGYNLKHTVNGSGAECLWKLHIKSLFCGPVVCRLQGYSSRCRCKCSLLWLLLVYYFNTFEKERAGGGRVLEPVFGFGFGVRGAERHRLNWMVCEFSAVCESLLVSRNRNRMAHSHSHSPSDSDTLGYTTPTPRVTQSDANKAMGDTYTYTHSHRKIGKNNNGERDERGTGSKKNFDFGFGSWDHK